MTRRFFLFILMMGAVLSILAIGLFFQQNRCFAQTVYYGPSSPTKGLVSVELLIYDETQPGGKKMIEANFNNTDIILKPAGVYGFRGGGSFKLNPGDYDLEWSVTGDTEGWPRFIRHKQKITVSLTDTWLQIVVRGETATVS